MKKKLSFKRLESLIKKKKCFLSFVYCKHDNIIKFVECRTPESQKTFIIEISDVYILKLPEENEEKKKFIIKDDERDVEEERIDFMHKVREKIDQGVIMISSSSIYSLGNNDEIKVYEITAEEDESKNINSSEEKSSESEEESEEEDSEEESEDSRESESVKLIFEDESDLEEELEDENIYIQNDLPKNIKEIGLVNGITYILISIANFIGAEQLESKIIDQYEKINELEKENNDALVKQIEILVQEIPKSLRKKIADDESEIVNLKIQLIRLTSLLNKTDKIKANHSENKKVSKEISKTKETQNEIVKTIEELNTKMIQLKDKISEMISNHFFALKLLINE